MRKSLTEETRLLMGGPQAQDMSEESTPVQAVSQSRAAVLVADVNLTALTRRAR